MVPEKVRPNKMGTQQSGASEETDDNWPTVLLSIALHEMQAQITSIHTRSSRTEYLPFQIKHLSQLIDREVVNTETQFSALEF